MTERVTVEGSGRTVEEWLESEIELVNASTENTQIRVFNQLKAIADRLRAHLSSSTRAEEIRQEIATEAQQAARAVNKSIASTREIADQMEDRWGAAAIGLSSILDPRQIRRAIGGDIERVHRMLDDIIRRDPTQRARVEQVRRMAADADMMMGLSKKQRDFVSRFPQSMQASVAKMAKSIERITLDPTAIVGVIFKLLPPWVDALIVAIAPLVRTLLKWNNTLFQMAEQGVSFNNNLMEMRNAAAQSAMGLSEFAALMKKHSTTFAQFGMTVTQGAKAFSQLSNTILRNYGAELAAQGISMEQVNEMLPVFMSSMRAGQQSLTAIDVSKQAESFKRLIVETDLMAKITGKSRQTLAEEVQKKTNDIAFQNALSKMDVAEREKVMATMTRMQGQFGELGGDLVKLRVLGLPPMTEAQRMAAAALGESVAQIDKATDAAMNTNVSVLEHQKKLDDASVNAMIAAVEGSKGMEAVLAAGSAGLGGSTEALAKVFNDMALQGIKFKDKNGNVNKEAIQQMYAKAREEQAQRDKLKASMDKILTAWKVFQAVLYDKVISPLYGIFTPIVDSVGDVAVGLIDAASGILQGVMPILKIVGGALMALWAMAIKPVLQLIGAALGFIGKGWALIGGLISDVGSWFANLFGFDSDSISEYWNKLWNDVGSWFSGPGMAIFGDIFDGIVSVVTDVITSFSDAWDFVMRIVDGIGSAIKTSWNFIINTLTTIGNIIKNPWNFITKVISTAGDTLMSGWNRIIAGVNWYIDTLKTVWNGLLGVISWASDIFMSGWDLVISGIKVVWSGLVSSIDWAIETFKEPWTMLLGGIDWLVSALDSAWNNLLSGIDSIVGALGAVWEKIKSMVGGVIGSLFGGRKPEENATSTTQIPAAIKAEAQTTITNTLQQVANQKPLIGEIKPTGTVAPTSANFESNPEEALTKLTEILEKMSAIQENKDESTDSSETTSTPMLDPLREQLVRIASLLEEQNSIARDHKSATEDLMSAMA